MNYQRQRCFSATNSFQMNQTHGVILLISYALSTVEDITATLDDSSSWVLLLSLASSSKALASSCGHSEDSLSRSMLPLSTRHLNLVWTCGMNICADVCSQVYCMSFCLSFCALEFPPPLLPMTHLTTCLLF